MAENREQESTRTVEQIQGAARLRVDLRENRTAWLEVRIRTATPGATPNMGPRSEKDNHIQIDGGVGTPRAVAAACRETADREPDTSRQALLRDAAKSADGWEAQWRPGDHGESEEGDEILIGGDGRVWIWTDHEPAWTELGSIHGFRQRRLGGGAVFGAFLGAGATEWRALLARPQARNDQDEERAAAHEDRWLQTVRTFWEGARAKNALRVSDGAWRLDGKGGLRSRPINLA